VDRDHNSVATRRIEGTLQNLHDGWLEGRRHRVDDTQETRAVRQEIQAFGTQLLQIKVGMEENAELLRCVKNEVVRENLQLVLSRVPDIAADLQPEEQSRPTRENFQMRKHRKVGNWKVKRILTKVGTIIFTSRVSTRYYGEARVESLTKFTASFYLPAPWLFGAEAALGYSSKFCGLTMHIRLRRYICPGNRAYSLVAAGDLRGLIQMLERGEISVHDCEEPSNTYWDMTQLSGRGTLLHVCVERIICCSCAVIADTKPVRSIPWTSGDMPQSDQPRG
jgi:hypothetical protein